MKKVFLLIALSRSMLITAQTETDIRKHYTETNQRITESIEHGFEGPLYNNQWVTNKNGRSWPAVGIYTETSDFWYDDPPDHLPASERNPKNVLLKVNINRRSSHLVTNEEYLFKEGKLIFYYSHMGEEGNEWETRIYFNNKAVAFKSSVKANGKELTAKDLLTEEYRDFKPDGPAVMAAGKKMQELFLKTM